MLKTTADERIKTTKDRVHGGAGFITREELLTPEQRGEYLRMFNRISLLPGCEIGHHEHEGEGEAYYFLSGTGMYEEDGVAIDVGPGDVTFCDDGHGHGVKNNGKEELVFIAVITTK